MRIVLVTTFVFIGLISFGQKNYGLYGKKNTIEINPTVSFPVFYRFNAYQFLERQGNNLVQGKPGFDLGLRFSFMSAVRGHFSIGFEYSRERNEMSGPRQATVSYLDVWSGSSYPTSVSVNHERVYLGTQTFIPKFNVAKVGDILPIGLSHEFGLGMSISSVKGDDYLSYTTSSLDTNYYDVDGVDRALDKIYETNYKGIAAMYQIKISTPLTRSILLYTGIRYNLNYVLRPSGVMDYSDEYFYEMVRGRRLNALMNFNLGLSYAF